MLHDQPLMEKHPQTAMFVIEMCPAPWQLLLRTGIWTHYTHTYIHTYMHTHIYILMMMHINTSIYIRTNINKQTAAHIHTYIHIYICVHKYIIYTRPCSTISIQPNLTSSCQCIHIYIYTCLCIYIYAYAQLHNIVCYVCCI